MHSDRLLQIAGAVQRTTGISLSEMRGGRRTLPIHFARMLLCATARAEQIPVYAIACFLGKHRNNVMRYAARHPIEVAFTPRYRALSETMQSVGCTTSSIE